MVQPFPTDNCNRDVMLKFTIQHGMVSTEIARQSLPIDVEGKIMFVIWKGRGLLAGFYLAISIIVMAFLSVHLEERFGGVFNSDNTMLFAMALAFILAGLMTYYTSITHVKKKLTALILLILSVSSCFQASEKAPVVMADETNWVDYLCIAPHGAPAVKDPESDVLEQVFFLPVGSFIRGNPETRNIQGCLWMEVRNNTDQQGWISESDFSLFCQLGVSTGQAVLYREPGLTHPKQYLPCNTPLALNKLDNNFWSVELKNPLEKNRISGYLQGADVLTGKSALEQLRNHPNGRAEGQTEQQFVLQKDGRVYGQSEYVRVTSPEGLICRYDPTVEGDVALTFPKNEILKVCSRQEEEVLVGGETGHWAKVFFDGFPVSGGWCFDSCLKAVDLKMWKSDLCGLWYIWDDSNIYFNQEGIPRYNLELSSREYYFFNRDGRLETGPFKSRGTWLLDESEGVLHTNEMKVSMYESEPMEHHYMIEWVGPNHIRLIDETGEDLYQIDLCRFNSYVQEYGVFDVDNEWIDRIKPSEMPEDFSFPFDDTALILAARMGLLEEVEDLLAAGCDVNAVNMYGFTALHEAVARLDFPIIRRLIRNAANPYIMSSSVPSLLEMTLFDEQQINNFSYKDRFENDRTVVEDRIIELRRILTDLDVSCQSLDRFFKTLEPEGEYHLPDEYLGEKIIPLPVQFLYRNKDLTSLYLPDSIESIGESAFEECSALKFVHLPSNLLEIPSRIFSYCDSLESMEIPEGVQSIGEKAFYHCISLKSLNIPDSVRSIPENAISGCDSLDFFPFSEKVQP